MSRNDHNSISSTTTPTADMDTVVSTPTPGRCKGETSVVGDVDGDGLDDLISFDVSASRIVVCSGSEEYTLGGAGGGEILEVADLNGDDIAEILVGGTAAWGAGTDVVALVEGELDFVVTPDGVPLSLWIGLPPQRFLTHGCSDFDDDGSLEVAVIEGDVVTSSRAEWRRTIYRVGGHTAMALASDSGSFDFAGMENPLGAPELDLIRGADC